MSDLDQFVTRGIDCEGGKRHDDLVRGHELGRRLGGPVGSNCVTVQCVVGAGVLLRSFGVQRQHTLNLTVVHIESATERPRPAQGVRRQRRVDQTR